MIRSLTAQPQCRECKQGPKQQNQTHDLIYLQLLTLWKPAVVVSERVDSQVSKTIVEFRTGRSGLARFQLVSISTKEVNTSEGGKYEGR